MFVRMMIPPAATASTFAGSSFTSHAANGAAMTPPMSSAATICHSMPCEPSAMRNPSEPPTATTNSLVSIDPMTFRGSKRPDESSVVVPTGPQPPPPMASSAPPTNPTGTSIPALGRDLNSGRFPPNARNRQIT